MRLLLRTILTVIATTTCVAALVSTAFAGSYVVSTCSPFSTPGVWTQVNTGAPGLTAGQSCGGPAIGPMGGGDQGALYGEDTTNGTARDIPNGAAAGWTFTAPPQTTITAISYYRSLATLDSENLVAGLFQADGSPLEQCMIPFPFPPGSSNVCSKPNSQAPVTFAGLNTSSLFFGVICRLVNGASACEDGITAHFAQADLYSARITISQTTLPTIGGLGGPLTAGGFVSGAVPVTFSASDPSGVQQAAVRIETGQTLAATQQPCDFTSSQPPCPQLPTGSLSADTTQVPDGPHTFALVVTDAAGNTQTAPLPPVVVDNHGPAAPAAFTATPASSSSNAIGLTWMNPATPPAPISGALAQLCQSTCLAPVAVNPGGSAQITAPAAGQYAVRLWLLDAQGHGGPQNAATATVSVPAGNGKPPGPGGGGGGKPPGTTPGLHTKIAATYKARRLHVSGTIARVANGTAVRVSWRSHDFGHTLASGSRVVHVASHRIDLTFALSATARRGTIGVAVRIGRRLLAGALARPA